MQTDRIETARRCAWELLHHNGVMAPEHIHLRSFAHHRLGIMLRHAPLDGADAYLVRYHGRATILINARARDLDTQRFSIAHEIGHFVLDHPGHTPADLFRARRPQEPGEPDYEAEANAFASELLMPRRLLGTTCETQAVDLEVPWRIAREYNVSILASSRRFAELASEPCAAVFSEHGKVKWRSLSTTFRQPIDPGRELSPSSVAHRFFATGTFDDHPQPVPAGAWLDTTADVEIIEHAIFSREYSTVLSMLWVPKAVAARLGMIP